MHKQRQGYFPLGRASPQHSVENTAWTPSGNPTVRWSRWRPIGVSHPFVATCRTPPTRRSGGKVPEAQVKPQIAGRCVVPKNRLAHVCWTIKERVHRRELPTGFFNDRFSPVLPNLFEEVRVKNSCFGEFNFDPIEGVSVLTSDLETKSFGLASRHGPSAYRLDLLQAVEQLAIVRQVVGTGFTLWWPYW